MTRSPLRAISVALMAVLAAGSALAADIEVSDVRVRAVPPTAKTTAVYMTLTNTGATDDRLIAVRSDAAARVEIHDTTVTDGVARMREQEDGVPVPAGGAATLAPGGLHVMFMGLVAPLAEGEAAALTLVFESGAEIAIDAPVAAITGMSMDHGHGASTD